MVAVPIVVVIIIVALAVGKFSFLTDQIPKLLQCAKLKPFEDRLTIFSLILLICEKIRIIINSKKPYNLKVAL